MDIVLDNMGKYGNYKEQMGRLKKAMNAGFYIEAIAIEYAVIEDRMESILRHSNKFNPDKHTTLTKKLNRVSEIQRNKTGLLRKYITEELIEEIHEWKNNRNPVVHALLKLNLNTEDLKSIAEKGQSIVKTLCSKVTSYNRALEKCNN